MKQGIVLLTGALFIFFSPLVSNLGASELQQYIFNITLMLIGLLVIISNNSHIYMANEISTWSFVAEFFSENYERVNKLKRIVIWSLLLIFVAALFYVIYSLTRKPLIRPSIYSCYVITIVTIIGLVVYNISVVASQSVNPGFGKKYGKFFTSLREREYLYLQDFSKPVVGWILKNPLESVNLSNKAFYKIDLNKFPIVSTRKDLINKEYQIDLWYRININENNLRKTKHLDKETLLELNNFLNPISFENLLDTDILNQVTGEIEAAHKNYQQAQTETKSKPYEYKTNRTLLLFALNYVSDTSETLKKKVNEHIRKVFNTPYLIGHEINFNVIQVETEIKYSFGNKKADGEIINTIDTFYEELQRKRRERLEDNELKLLEALAKFGYSLGSKPTQQRFFEEKYNENQQRIESVWSGNNLSLPTQQENTKITYTQYPNIKPAVKQLSKVLKKISNNAELLKQDDLEKNLENNLFDPYFKNVDLAELANFINKTDIRNLDEADIEKLILKATKK